MMEQTAEVVDEITDYQLVEHLIKHAKPKQYKKCYRWELVQQIFGLWSHHCKQICRQHNLDPNELISG